MSLSVENYTMTGSEQSHELPEGCSSVAWHANGGDIELRAESSGDSWTVKNGQKGSLNGRWLSKKTLYFTGADPAVLEFLIVTGMQS